MVRKTRLVAFTPEVGRRIKKNAGGTPTSVLPFDTKPRGGGNPIVIFRLIEDMVGGVAWARRASSAGVIADATSDPTEVNSWQNILDSPKADYVAMYTTINGDWLFVQGPCHEACITAGTLSVGSPPTGTVDTAYSHSVSGTGLTGANYSTVDFEGLPPGLTHTLEAISGTPTTAGTYYVIASATAPESSPGVGTCTITHVMIITINPEP